LDDLSPDATVIFIMNHRSNIDYMLVPYLVSGQGALSYAVGEWARIWPLSAIIRALGAFFIRRRSRGNLYRKVLARYVQMATAAGVTQAVFPEGGLSLTGRSAPPKLGLLNYIIEGYMPGGRDVIFVPVALNYDRVLEDRFLIAADKTGVRRFRPPLMNVVGATLSHLWLRVTGRFEKYGTASVGFGEPLSLAEFIVGRTGDPTEAVAQELMTRVNAVIPVLPVPLVARFLLAGETTVQGLTAQITGAVAQLGGAGMTLPRRIPATITADALEILRKRDLVTVDGGQVSMADGSADVLEFYANSIAHHFDAAAVKQ
jgi:glycerol-3-phosphate O-acyltransferase